MRVERVCSGGPTGAAPGGAAFARPSDMTPPPFTDVRMRGFAARTPVAGVLPLIDARTGPLPAEVVPATAATGRVLAEAVVAAANVPGFERAAMDGFAVRAADTADPPRELRLVGESLPARPFAGTLLPSQAVRIMTGAPVPAGADAVLVAEAATADGNRVLAREAVAPGRHVGRVGEDVTAGREVLAAGRRLRPQDVGLVAAVGVGTVAVVRRPRVALLVTGDELLPPGAVPSGYQIVDSNSPMLAALVTRDGGECLPARYLPDRFEAVRDAIRDADADLVLVSGGTSVGQEDHAPRAVAEVGDLTVHGIAVKPAGPTGIGFLPGGRVVVLLPGNPVSCLCAYDLFAGRVVRRLGGRNAELPYRRVTLPLAAEVRSAAGRVDYVRVAVTADGVRPLAAGGASNLSTAVAADGFVLLGPEHEGMAAGEMVDVWVYDT